MCLKNSSPIPPSFRPGRKRGCILFIDNGAARIGFIKGSSSSKDGSGLCQGPFLENNFFPLKVGLGIFFGGGGAKCFVVRRRNSHQVSAIITGKLRQKIPWGINYCNVMFGAVLLEATNNSVTVTVFLSVLCGNQLL